MMRTLSEPEPVTGTWVYTEAVYFFVTVIKGFGLFSCSYRGFKMYFMTTLLVLTLSDHPFVPKHLQTKSRCCVRPLIPCCVQETGWKITNNSSMVNHGGETNVEMLSKPHRMLGPEITNATKTGSCRWDSGYWLSYRLSRELRKPLANKATNGRRTDGDLSGEFFLSICHAVWLSHIHT